MSRDQGILVIGELEARRDFVAAAFESRLLRLLGWFGLVEGRATGRGAGRARAFRKTELFDRMLSFEINVPDVERLLH